jgi:hypothetical protein
MLGAGVWSASLSLTLSSLESIYEGETTTLTATVQAVGGTVSNVRVELAPLPNGLSTPDALIQQIGDLSAGASVSKSWVINGDVSGEYNLTVTASGTDVSDVYGNTSLRVLRAPFVESTITCGDNAPNVGDDVVVSVQVTNVGEGDVNVTISPSYSTSYFQLKSGSQQWEAQLAANEQKSVAWTFSTEDAGTETITFLISSTANDPADQSCSFAISAVCGDGLCSSGENCAADNNACPSGYACTNGCVSTSQGGGTGGTGGGGGGGGGGGVSPTPTPTPTPSIYPAGVQVTVLAEKTFSLLYGPAQAEGLLLDIGATEDELNKAVSYAKYLSAEKRYKVEKLVDDNGDEYIRTVVELHIRNDSEFVMHDVVVFEEIPKGIVKELSLSDISSSYPFQIVKSDPVVKFYGITLGPEKIVINYTLDLNVDLSTVDEGGALAVVPGTVREAKLCKTDCDDGNPCTKDGCNWDIGECVNKPLPDGTPCGEGMVCKEGKCVKKQPPSVTATPTPQPPQGVSSAPHLFPPKKGADYTILIILLVLAAAIISGLFAIYKKRPELLGIRKPKVKDLRHV